MWIVIDRDNLRMVAAAPTHKWADLVAHVDFPNVATTLVNCDDGSTWTLLPLEQMATLFTNMSGQKPTYYGDMLMQLRNYGGTWAPWPKNEAQLLAEIKSVLVEMAVEDSQDEPVQMAGFMNEYNKHQGPSEPAKTTLEPRDKPAKASAPKAAKEVSAPSKPGATKRVWEIADAQLQLLNEQADQIDDIKVFRKRVITICEEEGINPGTAATQFGKWKASKGL